MKKIFSVLVILCWLTPSAFPQGQPGQPGQQPGAGLLESYKIGFITRRLNLTPEEAQKFWPIYRYYTNEKRQVYNQYRVDRNELGLHEGLVAVQKKYSVEFLKAISPGKINDFFRAEEDFNRLIQREADRRRMQGRRFPPGN
ncbi:MAG TPA: hypothetical protein VHE34_27610 [Puia sp.]|uniref:hypothetical protein n=1 Tax=Puia sp. TaxID=2045100 RepID=UPI002BD92267|nr:hypothetical protein [Puia sp.]HVU99032.1 hypothetical protein [Puia sp.]